MPEEALGPRTSESSSVPKTKVKPVAHPRMQCTEYDRGSAFIFGVIMQTRTVFFEAEYPANQRSSTT